MRIAPMLRRLRRDTSGVAMIEFAFTLPFLAGFALYSMELTNYALVNMRVNQIALSLADNASRVGTDATLTTQQLREVDMNDVLQAARYQGSGIRLTTFGRIIVSSLENVQQTYDSTPTQRIHWQRCIGLRGGTNYDSMYGTTAITDGTTNTQANDGTLAPSGMGPSGSQVSAPAGSGLMFVQISYEYQPLVSGYFIGGDRRITFTASYIIRDNRDLSQIFNPSPAATRSTCNLYAA
jgi:Flp pilus assembly protein TadG